MCRSRPLHFTQIGKGGLQERAEPEAGDPVYNNPLYLDFLRGNREYQCTAWSNPTYTVMGWREPCYLLGDKHTQDVQNLFNDELWERYGVGKDPRCANCMMHCGFESASVFGALRSPKDALKMISEGAVQNAGVGA